MGKSFTARYDGVCPGCGDFIESGFDEVVMTDAGAQHVDCAPGDDEPVTFPL